MLQSILMSCFFLTGTIFSPLFAQNPELGYEEVEHNVSGEKKVRFWYGDSGNPATNIVSMSFVVEYAGSDFGGWELTNSWMDHDGACNATVVDDPGTSVEVTLDRGANAGASTLADNTIIYLKGGLDHISTVGDLKRPPIVMGAIVYGPEVDAYPSPATRTLHFALNQQPSSVRLLNMQGATVREGGNALSGDLDVSQLEAGVYLLQAVVGETVLHKKVMVNH